MKVLQVNTVYQNGGSTGRIVYDLSQVICHNGISPYVAYGYYTENKNDGNVLRLQSIFRRKINILRCRIWPRHGYYNIYETKKLLKWIDQIKPDIIHLHNIHNHYVNIGMLFDYIKDHNIPVVLTLHDCWSFTGWCAYFDYVECKKWTTECHHCPCKHDYPYTWFFDLSQSNFIKKRLTFLGVNNMTLVTPSQWLADLTRKSFLKNYPVEVINNGIDLNIFKPTQSNIRAKYNIPNDVNVILALMNGLDKRKGIDLLMKIPKYLKENEMLVVVGLKLNEIKLFPSYKCKCICHTNNIFELASLYSTATVFVNPTLEDNFPTTNIESLACGTPVVTFKTGGSPEIIDEKTGLIVDKNDFNGLLSAINIVVIRGKNSYRDSCIERARTFYDKDKQYIKYINLYNKIMSYE